MKKINLLLLCLMIVLSVAANIDETTVFVDDYNRTALTPGGAPSTDYTTVTLEDPSIPSISNNQLRIPNCKGSGKIGTTILTAPIAGYSSPFNSKIAQTEADSIVWTFNYRHNYTTIGTGGFSGLENNQRGHAVVLLADNADLTQANGYAIITGGDGKRRYRLVEFSNGITVNSNATDIIVGADLATAAPYLSMRVVYMPATNTWKYYERIESAALFSDPTSWIGYEYKGAAPNGVHTTKEMTVFGFVNNCYGNIDMILFVDDFSVRTYFNISTSIEQIPATYSVHVDKSIVHFTSDTHSDIDVYSTAGILVKRTEHTRQVEFELPKGGYSLIVTNEKDRYVQKIIIE